MTPDPTMPVCLTIAGSDSGGGAGIQADLHSFARLGTFGTSVITAITAQNPAGVRAIHPVPVADVRAQYEAVAEAFTLGAIKTGMLHSAELIALIAELLPVCLTAAEALEGGEGTMLSDGSSTRPAALVIDPVMVATSGANLLRDDAIDALRTHLLPRATLITPNLPEAALLLGRALPPEADAAAQLQAARDLAARFGVGVLLKGGHLHGGSASDLLVVGDAAWRLDAPRLKAASTHGTGCTLSAAIAAGLANGLSLLEAVRQGKAFVFHALADCRRVGPATWAMRLPAEYSTAILEVCKL